jgi:hypothetical protein
MWTVLCFVFTTIGAITTGVAIWLAICAAVDSVTARVRAVKLRNEERAREWHREQFAGEILSDSFWFGEHPPTMRLIQRMARGDGSVSTIRDDWRRECAEFEQAKTKVE